MAERSDFRGYTAVSAYLLVGALLSVVGWLLFGWWTIPIALVATLAVFATVWHIARDRWPVWSVLRWMRRNGVNKQYKNILFNIGKYIRVSKLKHPEAALAVVRFYHHDRSAYISESELADIVQAVNRSEAVSLGEDIRYCLQAMFSRARQGWWPAPKSFAEWLSRTAKLRADGVELDTIIAYFKMVPPGAALDALENGIPVEYAVT